MAGQVNVTLLLGGGHSRTMSVDQQDPLLPALLGAIQRKSRGGPQAPPLHLRLEGGRQSLVFSPDDLVGIITDPPLAMEAPPRVEKARWLILDDFLDSKLHADLLAYSVREEARFADSTVSTKDPDYRRSKILYDFPDFDRVFRERVAAAAADVIERLEMRSFPMGQIECQLTAHNDGNYFKRHNDNGSPDTRTRGLTYVYYFFNEPKAFSGGELVIYDSLIAGGQYRCGERAATVDPKNNSIIFFPPHLHHEVLPVRCPSKAFADGRFTVNGWVRKAA